MNYKQKAEELWNELYTTYQNQPPLSDTHDLWCSEWSWTPLCDGFGSYQHNNYPYIQIKDGIVFYATGTNYRVYAIWDLFKNKEECNKLSSKKNATVYEWDILFNKKYGEYGLEAEPYKMLELGWIKVE